ncbi:MAG: hypothetical protein J2O39_10950, partial [Acidimicrobiales bacterium]|nr:hypothetical protein [Acidimicrobiales bacterium]
MQGVQTTVVAVIGDSAAALVRAGEAANVRVAHPDPDGAALDRAVQAWNLAARSSAPYFLHDADPLAWVEGAWARRFEAGSPPGELEVAVTETVSRWRARSLELPDYYVLIDPESWDPARRHWYLGVLVGAAPRRVATVAPVELVASLPGLPPGPWWPELDRLLAGIENVVPDQAGARREGEP